MSPTHTVEDTCTAPPSSRCVQPPTIERPTRHQVAQTIREEARAKGVWCPRWRANRLISVVAEAAGYSRVRYYTRPYELTWLDMRLVHPVMDVVMPEFQEIPEPESAHEGIMRHLALGKEISIVHSGEYRHYGWACLIDFKVSRIRVTTT